MSDVARPLSHVKAFFCCRNAVVHGSTKRDCICSEDMHREGDERHEQGVCGGRCKRL